MRSLVEIGMNDVAFSSCRNRGERMLQEGSCPPPGSKSE